MTNPDASSSKHPGRVAAHPSITPEQISQLVDSFYLSVQSDTRLGPIFDERVKGDWEPHLNKMKAFWRSVLLKTGEYKGRPVPIHAALPGLTQADFALWLRLFRQSVSAHFTTDAQDVVIDASKRIASSLWLARADDPFGAPPRWDDVDPMNERTQS